MVTKLLSKKIKKYDLLLPVFDGSGAVYQGCVLAVESEAGLVEKDQCQIWDACVYLVVEGQIVKHR